MSFKVRRVRVTFLALAEHRWTDNMARVGFFYLWKTATLRNDGNKLQILSFLFRVLLVSKQQCDLFSPGRWMESQLTVIPHSTLRCVCGRKDLKTIFFQLLPPSPRSLQRPPISPTWSKMRQQHNNRDQIISVVFIAHGQNFSQKN